MLTTTVRTPDGTGSGWARRDASRLDAIDPATLGTRATQKARTLGESGRDRAGPLHRRVRADGRRQSRAIHHGALNARSADEGRSFFSKPGGENKIGEKVVDERVTITSDPFDPDVAGSPFSGDGSPTQRVVWIENGVVKNLDYDRYWAQKQGRAPTGAGGSIRMSGGTTSLDELIRSTQRGLLVTRFWYLRPVDQRTILYTGLTRDGTFLIENGKITQPVKNLRFNDSPIFMLNNLEAMGVPSA